MEKEDIAVHALDRKTQILMSLSVPAMFTVEPNKQTLGCIELYYHVFAIKKLYAMLNADLFASNLYASSPLESTTAQLYQKQY